VTAVLHLKPQHPVAEALAEVLTLRPETGDEVDKALAVGEPDLLIPPVPLSMLGDKPHGK
jgi:hypothetical protein